MCSIGQTWWSEEADEGANLNTVTKENLLELFEDKKKKQLTAEEEEAARLQREEKEREVGAPPSTLRS